MRLDSLYRDKTPIFTPLQCCCSVASDLVGKLSAANTQLYHWGRHTNAQSTQAGLSSTSISCFQEPSDRSASGVKSGWVLCNMSKNCYFQDSIGFSCWHSRSNGSRFCVCVCVYVCVIAFHKISWQKCSWTNSQPFQVFQKCHHHPSLLIFTK